MKIILLSCFLAKIASFCVKPPVTTISGTKAPLDFCSGDLIFEDNFDNFDQSKWRHEVTMAGGGNNEFQWYVNDRFNSYAVAGNLYIRPTFTSDFFGDDFLTSGKVLIPQGECSASFNNGCNKTATKDQIINPIRSARLDTRDSFAFKYGTVEIRAKMPAGDWIWPALWMMPRSNVYGNWPRSGEIDIAEMRGNRELYANGGHVGNRQVGSTIHFGPSTSVKNHWPLYHFSKNRVQVPFSDGFHLYKLTWSPNQMQFFIDNENVGTVNADTGFWNAGNFENSGLPNPWKNGSDFAPFDQEFYLIMNLAVGGTNYFVDSFENRNGKKPWLNTSPRASADFWEGRTQWQSSWRRCSYISRLRVDYVRVWAL